MKEFIERLISRLEEEATSYKNDSDKEYKQGIYEQAKEDMIASVCLRRAIQIVNQLAEEYNNGWIPCSERLPELFETYIVTIKMKYEWEKEWEYHVDVADYTCDDGYIDGAWNTFNDWCEGQECHVIAWQPLPAPFEPKGE